MKSKNLSTVIKGWAASFLCFMFVGCLGLDLAGSGSEAGNYDGQGVSAAALIDLPTSIAETGVTLAKKGIPAILEKATAPIFEFDSNTVEQLYEDLRAWTGTVDNLVNGSGPSIRNLMDEILSPLNWSDVERADTLTQKVQGVLLKAWINKDSDHPFGFSILNESGSDDLRYVSGIYLDSTDYSSGSLFNLYESEGDTLNIRIDFEATDSIHELEASFSLFTDSLGERPRTAVIKMLKNGTRIHISASACYPDLEGFIPDEKGYCQTYTAVVDDDKNLAVANMGYPPASHDQNGPEIFDQFGISRILGDFIVNNELADLDSLEKAIMATSLAESITVDEVVLRVDAGTLELRDTSVLNGLTIEEFERFIDINLTNPDEEIDQSLIEILTVVHLRQPVYFDENGFAGNGADVPDKFTDLAAEAVEIPPIIPMDARDLVVVEPSP